MSNINLEGGECVIPFDDVLKGLLNVIKLRNDAIEKAKDLLKNNLIDMFFEIGENETAEKIIKKGLPDNLIIHGEKTTCYKNEIIFIQTTPLVKKGKLLITWDEIPKFAKGGLVFNNEKSENVVSEITRKVKVNEPHALIFDGSKSDPEYLNKMAHLLNSSKRVMIMTDSEFNPHLKNGWND